MKRILALIALLAFVASCRMATYTAPLLPRFSATATNVVVDLNTNALAFTATVTGSIKLKDLLGDTGYQIYVSSVNLYTKTTNYGSTVGSLATLTPVSYGNTQIVRVTKASNSPNYEFSVSFTGIGNYGDYTGGIASATNAGRFSIRGARYNLALITEDGNNTLVLEDNTKLETTFTTTHN